MQENEDRIPAIEEGMVASIAEALLRSEVTDLLLGRRGGVRIGQPSKSPTLEQYDVLQQIEAALEVYRSYFYPPEHH